MPSDATQADLRVSLEEERVSLAQQLAEPILPPDRADRADRADRVAEAEEAGPK